MSANEVGSFTTCRIRWGGFGGAFSAILAPGLTQLLHTATVFGLLDRVARAW